MALFTSLENLFPFVPSDIGVLILAALLVRDGPLDIVTLWVAATLGNGAGALVPWAIARRFGPRIAQSRWGKRLLPPDTVSLVEREYVRFGLPGIFLCRLLPAVRFIVAPFAGLVGIGPIRTLLPLTLGAGLWYVLIVGGGWLVGGQRAELIHFLRDVNVGLALGGGLLIGAGLLWWYGRRQRLGRLAGERLAGILEAALAEVRQAPAHAVDDVPLAATTILITELAAADDQLDPAALVALEAHAKEKWGLGALPRGRAQTSDYLVRARAAAASTDHDARIALAAHIWRVALADHALSAHEAVLLERIAAFLSLTPGDVTEARRRGTRGDLTPVP